MTVSHDAYSEMTAEARGPSNPQTHSWTHTPSGTPKGVLVWVTAGTGQMTAADNAITGATYGGVAMTKVAEVHLSGASEPGSCWLFELLAGIPTGAQTVAFTAQAFPTSSTGIYPWLYGQAVTMASGGGSLSRADSDTINQNSGANPSVTMDAGANTGLSYLGGYSGKSNEADLAAAASCTDTGGYDFTASATTARVVRQTTPATGTFAIGWTGGSDETAMAAATYYEASATDKDPMGMSGFFGV